MCRSACLRRLLLTFFLCLFATAVSFSARFTTPVVHAQQSSPLFDPAQVPTPASPPLASVGRALYQKNCAPCHGDEGMGNGPTAATLQSPPTAFADKQVIWEKSPAELFFTSKFGRIEKLMPPWHNRLSDAQIWQAVAFAWSLHTNEKETTQGAALYSEQCASCHGSAGAGDGPDATPPMPNFADLGYSISHSQTLWLQGWQTAHPEQGADWTEAQKQATLEFIRTFSYIPPWQSPFRPGRGVISGRVKQGTPGGLDPAGLEVSLQAFAGFDLAANFTTTLDATGSFTFTTLASDPNIFYLASLVARDIRYSSALLTLSPESSSLQTEMSIYEGTDDASGVQISRMHWIIDSQQGSLVVAQIGEIGNRSDRTFIGTKVDGIDLPVTTAFAIPDGAEEIVFENGALGDRFQQVGNLVYDTLPVLPGDATQQIILRYRLPYDSDQASLTQAFRYPIGELTLLVADLPQLGIEAAPLAFTSREDLQGTTYQLWRTTNLNPQSITVNLTGLLRSGDLDPRTVQANPAAVTTLVPSLSPWMPFALGGVMTVGLLAVLLWAAQQGRFVTPHATQQIAQQQARLTEAIARLDDQYQLKELSARDWQRQRASLKAQLLNILTQKPSAR